MVSSNYQIYTSRATKGASYKIMHTNCLDIISLLVFVMISSLIPAAAYATKSMRDKFAGIHKEGNKTTDFLIMHFCRIVLHELTEQGIKRGLS